jgi:peptidoglycan hydrolase-like protein with peptidoglycan-binding domain
MRRPGRRTVAVTAGVVVVAGAGLLATFAGGEGGSDDDLVAATTIAEVVRRDLVVTDTYEGQLGYGDARPYVTDRAGVVTTVAASGSTVPVGSSLFSVDFEPTVVLTGAVPAYRTLDTSVSDGPDVRQLEEGLVALGHGAGVTVDEHFDAGTAAAVKRWEAALDRAAPDGVVELGDVAFASGEVRIGAISTDVGSRVQSDSTILEATPTAHVVTVDLAASRSNELEPGTAVALTMPDGVETTGKVATIGSQSSVDQGEGQQVPGGNSEPTVPVTITLDDPATAAAFDTGQVDVALERSRDDAATAVPVEALLALVEGGYAVEVADGATTRLVGVEVGTFADGFVGVTGDGIEPGTEIVVPA